MAARKTTTETTATPKRQRGYAVTIKTFIPMGEGTAAQIATLQVIQEMETGNISGLSLLAGVTYETTAKQTSRTVTEGSGG